MTKPTTAGENNYEEVLMDNGATGATAGALKKKISILYGVVAFLIINIIALYIIHFTDKPSTSNSSSVLSVPSSQSILGDSNSNARKAVSFSADGAIRSGAGTTGYLSNTVLSDDDLVNIKFAPIAAGVNGKTSIVSYYIPSKNQTVITTATVNKDKTATVSLPAGANVLNGVQVKDIATLSNTQAVFVQSDSKGVVYLVPGKVNGNSVEYLSNSQIMLSNLSATTFVGAISSTQFIATYFEPYSATSPYFQSAVVGTVDSKGTITLSKPLKIGSGNTATDQITNSRPQAIPAIPNAFMVTWHHAVPLAKNDTGLCVVTATTADSAVTQLDETCNAKYSPLYYVDSVTVADNVVALSFIDGANNYALTIAMVKFSATTKKATFISSFVVPGVSGKYDFGTYYSWFPTAYLRLISKTRLAVAFLNPSNQGVPSTQVFKIDESFNLSPVTPVMRLTNGEFSLAGTASEIISGTVTMSLIPASDDSFLVAYSGKLNVAHKRVSLLEFYGKPVGVASGSDLLLNGAVKFDTDLNAGKNYYATTKGDIVSSTSTDPLGDAFFIDNFTIVAKDSRIGTAVSKNSLYINTQN